MFRFLNSRRASTGEKAWLSPSGRQRRCGAWSRCAFQLCVKFFARKRSLHLLPNGVMMTKRPWPPLYRHPIPVVAGEAMFRRDGKIFAAVEPRSRSKCAVRDCYLVAGPMYRGPLTQFAPSQPPPPAFLAPGLVKHMMVFEPPVSHRVPRDRVHFKQPLVDKCTCSCLKVRSRSLENLCPSSDGTSSTNDEREVFRRRRKYGKENFKRRSMDNLLEHCGKPNRRKVRVIFISLNCVFEFRIVLSG